MGVSPCDLAVNGGHAPCGHELGPPPDPMVAPATAEGERVSRTSRRVGRCPLAPGLAGLPPAPAVWRRMAGTTVSQAAGGRS